MFSKLSRRLFVYLLVALSSLFLYACTPENQVQPVATPQGTLPVDPVFREFYRALGGEDVLGAAISNLFEKDHSQCQYTANALMCYDPNASETEHFGLFPLGRQLNVHDDPQVGTASETARVVDGYTIYSDFISLYDRMRGARYVGHPLTQVRVNYEQHRVEQYFENVGFYQRLDTPHGQVSLVALGASTCELGCKYNAARGSEVIGGEIEVQQPFAAPILRIGGVPVFGRPLTRPYLARDGNLEQVYEKAVFYAPQGNPSQMHLRPVALILGTAFSLPEPRMNDTRMVFYPTNGGMGYNVPRVFDEYIAPHGGQDISGSPISGIVKVESEKLYRQCFENYCLDYDPAASAELRIRLAPLGLMFIERNHIGSLVVNRFVYSEETVTLSVGELSPQVAATDPQEIYMVVVQRRGQLPLKNVEGDVTLTLPDGRQITAHMPPTDANGVSHVTIPAQPSVQNGSVVPYRICLNVPSDQPICAQESYLIWNSR